MAERRMFSKTVVDDDLFSQLSKDARLLYFYLGLAADDDGFISSTRKVMNNADVSTEALNELINSNYLIKFESNIILIRHWKQNNQIRSDRRHDTTHQKEMKQVRFDDGTKTYELCQPDDNQMSTTRQPDDNHVVADWLTNGKPRLVETRQEEISEEKSSSAESSEDETRLSLYPHFMNESDAFDNAINY